MERGNFLTEDTYLGKLTDPLTLNRYNYVKSSAPNYVDPSGHKKQSWTETADQAKKNWQEYNKMPVQDYDSGPDYGSKNKELLEELDKKLSTARTKLKKLMDAAEEKGRSVIGYCSDYKAGMDAGRKIAEAKYHNWELTLLFGKNAYKRDDYFWDTDLQEIYDQARNASNNKDAFSAGFTAGQTMFTIEILSLIVGALESGGSSSGGQQVVLPGVGEVTIPGDAAGSVAGVLPPGSILRDQENKKESEEEGKGDSNTQRNGVPVSPDYGSKNKELLEELDKKLSTARTKLKKLMDAAEEKGRSVIGYCSDYKAGMDAGRKIAEAKYHNWELTLLFGKNAYKRDDYFWDTDLQEIYDQARNASNNKDAFSAGFTAGQTMFTIEILSLIVGALESGGSSSGGQQVVLPGVGEVTIPGDAAGSVAGVLPPGSILRDQENKKESEEEGKGDSNTQRNGVPVKEKTKASNGLDYQSNPKHTPGQPGNRPNAGIEPKNSLDLFGESVPSTSKPNQRFTYDAETSTLHRFYNDGNGTWHWSGSTNQGANSTITGSQVPNDIKNIFGLPKKGW